MKITSLDIERFGLWTDLHLSNMEGGLNVFYGPNEAGKTTLMDFVRSILYGLHEERMRYVFPYGRNWELGQNEGKRKEKAEISGGSLAVTAPDGQFRVRRMFDPNDIQIGTDHTLSITTESAEHGTIHQETAALESILLGIDEPTFNNVFTFGLDELRVLGTLDDTAAAEMLFRLSIGLDRIALIDVLRSLNKSRTELLNPEDSKKDTINRLLHQRAKINDDLGQSRTQIWEYTRILTEQRKLDRIIGQINDELGALRYDLRINEIAKNVLPIWDRRTATRIKIKAMGTPINVPEEAILELDELDDALVKRQEQLGELKQVYFDFKKKIQNVPINVTLWNLAPRIEIVLEEETRIVELDQQITQLENEATLLENEFREQDQQLRHGRRKAGHVPDIDYHPQSVPNAAPSTAVASGNEKNASQNTAQGATNSHLLTNTATAQALRSAQAAREMQYLTAPEPIRNLGEYRVYSRHVKRTKRNHSRSKKKIEELTERSKTLSEKLNTELSRLESTDLQEALDRYSDRVNQLRKRQAIANRVDEMNQYRKELERQSVILLQNQAIPPWAFVSIVGFTMITVVLLILVFFTNKVPPAVGGFSVVFCVVGWLAKTMFERQNSQKLEHNQRQMTLLLAQLEQAKNDGAAIDAKFPSTGLSVENRYQNAQKELLVLEKLIPVDAQRKEAAAQLKSEQERFNVAKNAAQSAHKRWLEWLESVSLPSDWTPQQIHDLIGRYGNAGELRRNLDRTYEDINQRVRDLRIITDRIDRVVAETGLDFPDGMSYVEMLSLIRRELQACEDGFKQRKKLVAELKKLKPQRKRILQGISEVRTMRTAVLTKYGVSDADELQELAVRYHDYQELLALEEGIQRELNAAVGNFCTEDTIAPFMDNDVRKTLDSRGEQISRNIESSEAQLREETEKHGRFAMELQQLAQDQSALKKRRELSVVNIKIRDAVRSWQVQAVSCRILEDIRKAYEREKQPAALAETSDYFRRLTAGKYKRVWTPLGEDTLKIDDAEGNTMDATWFSRGTREQLFISLRLALSAQITRRGADLPLILDDVLVNFDTARAKTAAKVLTEIAETGKQVILFTCHEHIGRIFQQIDVPVRILPKFGSADKSIRVLLPISMLQKKEPELKPKKTVRKKVQRIARREPQPVVRPFNPFDIPAQTWMNVEKRSAVDAQQVYGLHHAAASRSIATEILPEINVNFETQSSWNPPLNFDLTDSASFVPEEEFVEIFEEEENEEPTPAPLETLIDPVEFDPREVVDEIHIDYKKRVLK